MLLEQRASSERILVKKRIQLLLLAILFVLLRASLVSAQQGSVTTIDVAGASSTQAFGINDGGQIVRFYSDSIGIIRDFIRTGSSFTTIAVPFTSSRVEARVINNAGQIVGTYTDSSNVPHGFLRTETSVTTIDVAGASSTQAFG